MGDGDGDGDGDGGIGAGIGGGISGGFSDAGGFGGTSGEGFGGAADAAAAAAASSGLASGLTGSEGAIGGFSPGTVGDYGGFSAGFGYGDDSIGTGALAAQADAQAAISGLGYGEAGFGSIGQAFGTDAASLGLGFGNIGFGFTGANLGFSSPFGELGEPNAPFGYTDPEALAEQFPDITEALNPQPKSQEEKEAKTQEQKNLETLQALVAKHPTLTMEYTDPAKALPFTKSEMLPTITVSPPPVTHAGKQGLPGLANTANPQAFSEQVTQAAPPPTTSITGMPPGGLVGPTNAVPGFPSGIGVTPTQSMPDIGVTATPQQLSTGTFGGTSYGTSIAGTPADTASQLGMPNVPQSHINTGFSTIAPQTNLRGKGPVLGVATSRGEAMENEAIQAVKGIAPKGLDFNQVVLFNQIPTLNFTETEPTAEEDAAALAKANQEAIALGYMTAKGTPGKGVITTISPVPASPPPVAEPTQMITEPVIVDAPTVAPVTGKQGLPGPPNTTNPQAFGPVPQSIPGQVSDVANAANANLGYADPTAAPNSIVGAPNFGAGVNAAIPGVGAFGGQGFGVGAIASPYGIATAKDTVAGGMAGISTSAVPYGLTQSIVNLQQVKSELAKAMTKDQPTAIQKEIEEKQKAVDQMIKDLQKTLEKVDKALALPLPETLTAKDKAIVAPALTPTPTATAINDALSAHSALTSLASQYGYNQNPSQATSPFGPVPTAANLPALTSQSLATLAVPQAVYGTGAFGNLGFPGSGFASLGSEQGISESAVPGMPGIPPSIADALTSPPTETETAMSPFATPTEQQMAEAKAVLGKALSQQFSPIDPTAIPFTEPKETKEEPQPTQQQIDKAKETLAKNLPQPPPPPIEEPKAVVPLPMPRPEIPVEPPPKEEPISRPPPTIVDTPLTRETIQQLNAIPPGSIAPATPAVPAGKGTLGTGITGFSAGQNLADWVNQGRRIAAETSTPVKAVTAMQSLYNIPT